MSVSHRDVLRLLFPIELGGAHLDDLEVEGRALDLAQARAQQLLAEMLPDTAYELLVAWERALGLNPETDEPLQSRRDKASAKFREKGGLSRRYFIDFAASLGFEIEIFEYLPFMAGVGRAGEPIYAAEISFCWRITILNQIVRHFRAGQSVAGERLLWWIKQTFFEERIRSRKPAHTFVHFSYSD